MLSSLALGSFLSHETLDYKSEFVLSCVVLEDLFSHPPMWPIVKP